MFWDCNVEHDYSYDAVLLYIESHQDSRYLKFSLHTATHTHTHTHTHTYYNCEVVCCCCCSLISCLILCKHMDCSTPGFPVLHYLPEFAQTHVH